MFPTFRHRLNVTRYVGLGAFVVDYRAEKGWRQVSACADDLQPKDVAVGVEVEVEHAFGWVERDHPLRVAGADRVVEVDVGGVGFAVVAADQADAGFAIHGHEVVMTMSERTSSFNWVASDLRTRPPYGSRRMIRIMPRYAR
jgi:hypothetical protein